MYFKITNRKKKEKNRERDEISIHTRKRTTYVKTLMSAQIARVKKSERTVGVQRPFIYRPSRERTDGMAAGLYCYTASNRLQPLIIFFLCSLYLV